jgi:hypothetical protein
VRVSNASKLPGLLLASRVRIIRHLDGWISVSVSQHWLTDSAERVDEEARVAAVVTVRQRNQSDSTEKKEHKCLYGQRSTHDSTEETITSRKNSVVDVVLSLGISFPQAMSEKNNNRLVPSRKNVRKKAQIYFSFGAKVLTLLLELPI